MASLSPQVFTVRQGNVDISTLSVKALSLAAAIDYSTKVAPVEFFFEGDKLPHFRCPPGTRRAGKWTDKLGTDCELGGARVALARIGERMQRIAHGENARGDLPSIGERVEFRMNRMADRLDPHGGRGGKRRGRGVATVLEDAANALDHGRGRKRRGRGAATVMEDAANALDGGRGRKKPGRGAATVMEDAANALDGGQGKKPGRGVATALEDAANALDGGKGKPRKTEGRLPRAKERKRRDRGAATIMEDAASALDGGQGGRGGRGGRGAEGGAGLGVRQRGDVALREGRRVNEQAQRTLLEQGRRQRAAEGLTARTDVTAARSVARSAPSLSRTEASLARRERRAPKPEDVVRRDGKDISKFNEDELRAHRAVLDAELKDLQKQRNEARQRMRDPEGAGHGETAQIQDYNDQIEGKRAAIKMIDKRIEEVRQPGEKKPPNDILGPTPGKKSAGKKVPVKKKKVPAKRKAVKKTRVPSAPGEATRKEKTPSLRPSTRLEPTPGNEPLRNLSEVDADLAKAREEAARYADNAKRHDEIAARPIRRNPPPNVQSNITEWRQAENDRPALHREMAAEARRKEAEAKQRIDALEKERKQVEDAKKAEGSAKKTEKSVAKEATPAKKVVKKKKVAAKRKAVKKSAPRKAVEPNPAGGEASIPPATPPNPSGSTPRPKRPGARGVSARQAEWEKKGLVAPDEVRVDSGLADYGAAVQHIKNDGDIAQVPDGQVVEAMLDDDIKIVGRQGTHKWADILDPNGSNFGARKFSNSRYEFKLLDVKAHPEVGLNVWHVYTVKDKHTGETYFLKACSYGFDDALLEQVGADAMRIAGFPADDKQGAVRFGRDMKDGQRQIRWSLQRHVGHVFHDKNKGPKDIKAYEDWGIIGGGGGNIHPEDLARIFAVDFLFDNEDRHAMNIKLFLPDGAAANGELRIAPIDAGLMFGGRLGEVGFQRNRRFNRFSAAEMMARAELRGKMTPAEYRRNTRNNALKMLGRDVRWTPAQRRRAITELRRQMDRWERLDVEAMFDPARFERRGGKLTAEEKAHLAAVKRAFELRLEQLKKVGPEGMLRAAGL